MREPMAMTKPKYLFVAIIASALILIWLGGLVSERKAVRDQTIGKTPSSPQSAPAALETTEPAISSQSKPSSPPLPPPSLTAEERQKLFDAIDNLEFMFRDFANALGGNPVGTNAEITAALQGDNVNQLKLETPVGSSINRNGELCDPWGTPWFFHQLSATKMEIRSAGPDRVLYNEDDFVR